MRPYVKEFYQNLRDGKIVGAKCDACGSVSYPPIGTCSECGSDELSLIALAGTGTLIVAVPNYPLTEDGRTAIAGYVRLDEGAHAMVSLEIPGFDFSLPEKIQDYYGKRVRAKIVKNADAVPSVVFETI